MRFRSKSFNINCPSVFEPLYRSKSTSDIGSPSFDIRLWIKIKKSTEEEMYNVVNSIMIKTMKYDEWQYHNKDNVYDNEQKKWNERHAESHGIFRTMDLNIELGVNDEKRRESKQELLFFVAYFKGVPIGVLQLTPSDDEFGTPLLEVSYIAAHCGIRNCGVLLIEHAVNESQQLCMNGNLKINPIPASRQIYINMGFTESFSKTSKNYLYLNPAKSLKWHFINDRYKYKLS
ncbi:GNAT family N-acetyltransferase [Xenorhabdus anantnagensis]|uniref:GNAT family N-acetyltransferase n=1 Tax=Xenorhabdus anantnagensis TaxID=3025875 RepID=A0ABT5LNR4_9GAMM|nr:GNAT family N-acetyltransferase [Xenorhabdus anantnagensis]MDC9596057.1 GNAT family N-acetyltransferase [Xenorhabdus anantnagensis]